MANSSFDIKKNNNHTKNPTSCKCFCNNLHWVHIKSKVKKIIFGIIIVELRYSLTCFEYYARSNILNTDSSRLWENKFSSTEKSDLGDDFCKSLFVLCPLDKTK
jgi:hypothetical protein